jgi:hypothetical protein
MSQSPLRRVAGDASEPQRYGFLREVIDEITYEYMAEVEGQLYMQPGYFAVIVPYAATTTGARRSRSRMTRRARVERFVIGGTDAFNMKLPPVWQTITSVQPCWLWTRTRRLMSDLQGLVTLEDTRALFPPGADIKEGDRLSGITDRLGTGLWSGAYRVDVLTRRPDHLEALLAKVD